MKFTSSRLLVALSLAAISINTYAADKATAYVSNESGGVGVVDLDTMQTTGSIDVQAKGPRGIGITADGKFLITANKDNANISVIDLASGKVAEQIPIGPNPEFVRVYGDKVFVTYEPSSTGVAPPKPGSEAAKKDDDDDKTPGRIAIVDLKQHKVVNEIIGKPETEGLEFSKDGKFLAVTNESDNSITVHNTKTGKLVKTIVISNYGERPRGIKIAPDGQSYVVTLEFSNKMLVLDSQFNPIKTVDTGKAPYGVSFDRSGQHIFVAAAKDKLLQVFDAKSLKKIKDIPTGQRCWHFSFTPDDKDILLACGRSNELVVVDTDKLEVTKRIADKDMPWGIVTYPKSMGSLDKP